MGGTLGYDDGEIRFMPWSRNADEGEEAPAAPPVPPSLAMSAVAFNHAIWPEQNISYAADPALQLPSGVPSILSSSAPTSRFLPSPSSSEGRPPRPASQPQMEGPPLHAACSKRNIASSSSPSALLLPSLETRPPFASSPSAPSASQHFPSLSPTGLLPPTPQQLHASAPAHAPLLQFSGQASLGVYRRGPHPYPRPSDGYAVGQPGPGPSSSSHLYAPAPSAGPSLQAAHGLTQLRQLPPFLPQPHPGAPPLVRPSGYVHPSLSYPPRPAAGTPTPVAPAFAPPSTALSAFAPPAEGKPVTKRSSAKSTAPTSDAGSAKRRRTLIACERCRQHKLRCLGGRPCPACAKRGVGGECTYVAEVRRRGKAKKNRQNAGRSDGDGEDGADEMSGPAAGAGSSRRRGGGGSRARSSAVPAPPSLRAVDFADDPVSVDGSPPDDALSRIRETRLSDGSISGPSSSSARTSVSVSSAGGTLNSASDVSKGLADRLQRSHVAD